MLTRDVCDLRDLVEFLAEYPLYYYGVTFEKDLPGRADKAGLSRRLNELLDEFEYSVAKLEHWGEITAAKSLRGLIEACRVLPDETRPHAATVAVQSFVRRAMQVNNHLQSLAPLATRVSEVLWQYGKPSESKWSSREPVQEETTRRRRGYLLCLWCCRDETLAGAAIWRMVRRGLSHVGALRLRPYKSTTGRRTPEKIVPPRWRRVPVPVVVPLFGEEAGAAPADDKRRRLEEDLLLKPGPDQTLLHLDAPWTPEEPSDGLEQEAIGYFFLPAKSEADDYGLEHRELLALLIRLTWELCAHIPGEGGRDRFGFRLFATQVELEWQSGGPKGRDLPGHTPPRILDRWSFMEMIPRLFRDPATRNCTLVDASLLEAGEPHSEWFRPTWHIPVAFRRRAEPPSPWLMSTPRFDGRPSWIEHIDLSRAALRRPDVYPGGREFPPLKLSEPIERPRRFRRSARIEPPRPLHCTLGLRARGGSEEIVKDAYLLNYSSAGCCLFVPKVKATFVDRVFGYLGQPGEFGLSTLTVGAGVPLPWGVLHSGRGGTVAIALPFPSSKEEESRVVWQGEGKEHPVLHEQGVRIRLLIGSVVSTSTPGSV